MSGTLDEPAVTTINGCPGQACGAFAECVRGSIVACASRDEDVSPVVTSLCAAEAACSDGGETAAECEQGLNQSGDSAIVRCFSAGARSAIFACVQQCSGERPIENCSAHIVPLFEELASGFEP